MRRFRRDFSNRNLIHAARQALGLVGNRYPADLEREAVLPDGRKVRLLRSGGVRSRTTGRHSHVKNRIEIKCQGCSHWMPIGRMHQHAGTKACQAAACLPPPSETLETMADLARTSAEMREVLHDALLETYPREFQRMIDAAEESHDAHGYPSLICFDAKKRTKKGRFIMVSGVTVQAALDVGERRYPRSVLVHISGSRRFKDRNPKGQFKGDPSRRRRARRRLTRKSFVSRFVKRPR